MAVKTHRTLGSDTFSHGRVQCVLAVSFTLLKNCRESCLCELGNGSLMAKAIFSPAKAGELQPETFKKDTLVHFLLISPTALVKHQSFLKENAAFHFLLGSHLILLLHLIRVTTGMTFNTHRTISPDLLSHGMVHSVMGLSLHSSETAGKHVFVNL